MRIKKQIKLPNSSVTIKHNHNILFSFEREIERERWQNWTNKGTNYDCEVFNRTRMWYKAHEFCLVPTRELSGDAVLDFEHGTFHQNVCNSTFPGLATNVLKELWDFWNHNLLSVLSDILEVVEWALRAQKCIVVTLKTRLLSFCLFQRLLCFSWNHFTQAEENKIIRRCYV